MIRLILVIAEKPSVAKKIASALGKAKKKSLDGIPYYEVERGDKKIVVASAVGHLFTLVEKERSFNYPVFNIKWAPAYVEKGKDYVKKYIKALKELSKKADDIYIATDYDIEGELIGYHALKFCCGRDKGKRMRFSSLTKKEIVKAFENPKEIDYGLVDAGESRHIIDWYFGINLSRALMRAIKALNEWKTLSIGRVQGPTLKFLVDREKEIKEFKPKPYWVLEAIIKNLKAIHEKEKFWDEKEAKAVYEKIKDEKFGLVKDVKRSVKKIKPPAPFDLGTLQREAYNYFKFSPKKTQETAQKLYEKALISYPRTSSQKLPKDWNYLKEVLKTLKDSLYWKWAERIIREKRKPVEGKKEDPAHPAIHIVDYPKEELNKDEAKIYDLIARRTLSAFWDDMEREYFNAKISIKDEIFKLSGAKTKKEGWHSIYIFPKYENLEINLNKGERIEIDKINLIKKETQPPKRYSLSSIIKELEKKGLGTKATRAEIVDKLIRRGYVVEENGSLRVTDLGISVIETLERFCPEIVDEKLTRDLEEKLEKIQFKKIGKDKVLDEAERRLREVLKEFKEKEVEVGKSLLKKEVLGKCPKCGSPLVVKNGKYGKFIGCSNYPKCRFTKSL